ncbi:MAG: alpha/beta fold hydrolase [Alphaproteobacteria bacterium]|nr:alpha/beta fold hydrolase [Alphaproteobacteria bacterium]
MNGSIAEVNGVRLRYRIDGKQDGEPLALVNMATVNLGAWDPTMDRLASRFRVLRHDVRGTGGSTGGVREGYTFSQYADDVAALMDHVGMARAFVVGIAYGARTAGRFALLHAPRLTRLGLFDVSFAQPVGREAREAKGEEARALLAAAGEPPVAARKDWFKNLDRETARLTHTAHQDEPDITEALAAVVVPTLVACGRQDLNLPQAERIARTVPEAEFHVMEMTGHGSTFFRPGLVADLIASFADRHPAG